MITELQVTGSNQMTQYFRNWQSPYGTLRLIADDHHFLRLELPIQAQRPPAPERVENTLLLPQVVHQLSDYFTGHLKQFDLTTFDLPCLWQGTSFQQMVWQALLQLPYGQTCSYGDLAKRINRPQAVRAVGAANGANPFPIIAACHRVIASNGKLHGYGGGLELKRQLLTLETSHCD